MKSLLNLSIMIKIKIQEKGLKRNGRKEGIRLNKNGHSFMLIVEALTVRKNV